MGRLRHVGFLFSFRPVDRNTPLSAFCKRAARRYSITIINKEFHFAILQSIVYRSEFSDLQRGNLCLWVRQEWSVRQASWKCIAG